MPAGAADSESRPSTADEATAVAAGARGEREGPLVISRLRKDDGRALILYSHASSEAQDAHA